MPLVPPLNLDAVNQQLENQSPRQILEWVWKTFGKRAALQSSMQKTASTLSHLIYSLDMKIDVLFVDTGVHFPETLQTRDLLAQKYNLNVITLHPARTMEEQRQDYGRDLYMADGDYQICCELRKEAPFLGWVRGRYDAVIGGLMRSEGGKRSRIRIIGEDDRMDAYKIYPLANWDEEKVDEYNERHEVPVHPLHFLSFPSIGCSTCTTPVAPGENPRAGRWRHIREAQEIPVTHLYCGINREDK